VTADLYAYRVVFDGQFEPGIDRAKAAGLLRDRLKLTIEQTKALLLSSTHVLHEDLSHAEAEEVLHTMRQAGLVCHAEQTGIKADPLFAGAHPLHEYMAGVFSTNTAFPHPAIDSEINRPPRDRLFRLEQCHYQLRQLLPDIEEIQIAYEDAVNRRSELAGVLVLTDYMLPISPQRYGLRTNDKEKIETEFDDIEVLSDRLTLRCQDIYDVALERLGIILSFYVDGSYELHEVQLEHLNRLIDAWESIARTKFNTRDIVRESIVLDTLLTYERSRREDLYPLLHDPARRAHGMIQTVQNMSSKTVFPFGNQNAHFTIDRWIAQSKAVPRRGEDIREYIKPINAFTRVYPSFVRNVFNELCEFASRVEHKMRTEGVKVAEEPVQDEGGFDLYITDVDECPAYGDLYGNKPERRSTRYFSTEKKAEPAE